VIPFHKLLIGTAVVFCAGMGLWAALNGALVIAVVSFAAAAALAYYLRHLKQFLGR
jgi:uncharacterized membrane protein